MGLFDKLTSMFRGGTVAEAVPTEVTQRGRSSPLELRFTATFSGPTPPPVSDAEVESALAPFSFVLTNELPPLKTADQWWEEATHKRRQRDGSEKALSWLEPFVPKELAKSVSLTAATNDRGPLRAEALTKELRGLVRERRKLKQPHDELLRALYGACLMSDFVESLEFFGIRSQNVTKFVSASELQGVQLDYRTLGYQGIDGLVKTDVKWLIEAFGEPVEHQSFNAVWPAPRENAISRCCWVELTRQNGTSKSLGLPEKTMSEWMAETTRRNIGYQKEWRERVEARLVRDEEAVAAVAAALDATAQPFVVADLETTGLSAADNEILEFAAILVAPDGSVQAEFSALVRVAGPLTAEIVQLTGITDEEIGRDGKPLAEALHGFLAFVGTRPVFFHNAPFDQGFVREATAASKNKFSNRVHDTLPLARRAWPELGSFKLSVLADIIGAPPPTHRALADTRAALAVLLAAREKLVH